MEFLIEVDCRKSAEIIDLKLQLYCPNLIQPFFSLNGYFVVWKIMQYESCPGLPHFYIGKRDEQISYCEITVKAFSVILKAFGLKLVTESNEGIRKRTRSFKELTINTDII